MKGVEIQLRIIPKKYGVDSAVQFLKNSILELIVFLETIRQRGS